MCKNQNVLSLYKQAIKWCQRKITTQCVELWIEASCWVGSHCHYLADEDCALCTSIIHFTAHTELKLQRFSLIIREIIIIKIKTGRSWIWMIWSVEKRCSAGLHCRSLQCADAAPMCRTISCKDSFYSFRPNKNGLLQKSASLTATVCWTEL